MNYSTYRASLDIHAAGSQAVLHAKQGDTKRRIFVTLTEDGKPYLIGSDCRAVFTAKKPDGNKIFNDCTIEGNIICYTFTAQTTVVAGRLDCEIRLYGADNALITSPSFDIIVDATVYNDGDVVESASEVSALTSLVSEANTLIDSVNKKLENGEFTGKEGEPGGWYTPEIKQPIKGAMVVNFTPSKEGMPAAPGKNIILPQGETGETGGYYTPAVTQPDENTLRVAFTPSKEDMPDVEPKDIILPSGGSGSVAVDSTLTASGKAADAKATGDAIRSLSEEIANIPSGKDGADGQDGITPTIGENGNWYLGDTDTGKPSRGEKGDEGQPGKDGQDGSPGKDGNDGQPGKDGTSPVISVSAITGGHRITITDANGTKTVDVMDGSDGKNGADGQPGADGSNGQNGQDGSDGVGIQSVEQTTTSTEDGGTNVVTVTKTDGTSSTFSVKNGSKGSKGDTGAQGEPGADGAAGADGKSAYEYAVEGGYGGTEEEFASELGGLFGGSTVTVLSDNLFDKSIATTGKIFYHSSSGPSLIDISNGFYAYVPLRGAGTYTAMLCWVNHGESYATRVPILKEDKTFLQNVTGTLTKIDSSFGYIEFTITETMISNGAALYAFDGSTNTSPTLDEVMIVKDREYPSEYIPYGYIEVEVESADPVNILSGKTAVFLGDSICAGTTTLASAAEYGYGWGGLIGTANKMKWKNFGRNGGTIAPISSVESSRWISTQVDLALAQYPDADYVIFEGGCNDADTLGLDGLGTLSESGYAPSDDSDFTGAFETLVLKILNAYPNAKVGYIVAQKMGVSDDYGSTNNRYRKFFDRAVAICEKWGIPVLDLWKCNPLNPKLSAHYNSSLTADEANTAGKFYTDGQHLTLAGYQRITPQIEAFMRNL